jgi:hypothetical protein
MEIESDPLLLLALAASGITLLLGILVIAVRARKMDERLAELDAMKRSLQQVQRDFAEIVRISDRTFVGLRELSGVGLHFRQIKREQLRLWEKLQKISSATDSLARLLQRRDQINRDHPDELKEIVEASRSLQEWRSRMTAVCADADHLFESEPIRELVEGLDPQPLYAGEPAGRSEGRTRPSQKRVRPRRKR